MPEHTAVHSYKGVVINPKPRVDEVTAIEAVERLQGSEIQEIVFYDKEVCPPELSAQWIRNGYLSVDIGNDSYRRMGVGSVTESVFQNLGCRQEKRDHVQNKILSMLQAHNKTGCLKGHYMSLAWLAPELYELDGYDQTDVMMRLKDVARLYWDEEERLFHLNPEDRKQYGNAPQDRPDSELAETLPDLYEATLKCKWHAFTAGRYLRDLWRAGTPAEEIRGKVSFWVNAWNRFQEEMAGAKQAWSTIRKLEFNAGTLACSAIETGNRLVAKIGAPTVAVLIVRNPDSGKSVIFSRRLDLSSLNGALQSLEPGRWYYHTSAGHLINGGSRHNVQATGLSLDQIADLVKRFPPR